jgi:uncharacterized protein YndB with AHSA1/START domain
MIKITLIAIVIALLAVLAYAATQPDSSTITRSQLINAPADKLYAIISTPRDFEKWSPYSPKDPQMKNSYSGPASGVGARNDFVGNNQVGQGSVEIIRSTAPREVAMRLIMLKPFAADNEVVYSLKPQGTAMEVTWAMTAKNPYFAKVIGVFINMDKMIGGDFEVGLLKLKTLAEKS